MSAQPAHSPAMPTKAHFHIVVAGEFNAGKSSVINLLLRKNILPAQLNVSNLPPAHICPATEERYTVTTPSGQIAQNKSAFLQGKMPKTKAAEIRIHTPLPQFEGAMITELSVDQDGTLSAERLEILQQADLLIWCTMGQRAWCLSEISIVETLPPALLETAILAVSRTDYLRNTDNLAKVETRVNREAGTYFNTILMLDCSKVALGTASDEASWKKTGGAGLFAAVQESFRQSPFYGKAPLALAPPPETVPPSSSLSAEDAATAWADSLQQVVEALESSDAWQESTFARRAQKAIAEFAALVLPAAESTPKMAAAKAAFAEANAYLAAKLDTAHHAGISQIATRLLLQLERELKAPLR
jgi:hypothetical protein